MKKDLIVVPSKIGPPGTEEDEGAQQTEIAAEISVPTDGGWGWIVLAASYSCNFILDGVIFTFGSIYPDMTRDLGIDVTLIALINSLAVALYFITGPITSALINRFGFRACTMTGSVILSFSFLFSYFATSYLELLTFYGIISGFGGCLVSMSSGIVVGFYFERYRALALAFSGTGSSLGIMCMFSLNAYLVNLVGWRITTLFHSGLFGLLFFLAMAYRPLLSLSVIKTTEDPARTVTYLPSLTQSLRTSTSKAALASGAERLFSAVSSKHFPTAASVVEEGIVTQQQQSPTQAGPSSAGVSKLTLIARSPQSGISRRQLKQVHSIISRASVNVPEKNVEVTVQVQKAEETKEPAVKKKSWWARLCHWEEHIRESRPMYRDDAFYEGRLEHLPAYQKSVMDTIPEARTGLEYHMAVTRAVTTADLEERSGILTTAVRRILATMLDPKLLKRCSFLLLCCSGFCIYIGLLVPYVFLPDRSKSLGIDHHNSNLFVSVIGFSNAVGRILAGLLAVKFNPITLYYSASILAGIGAMSYNFSVNLYYQYLCCVIFGLFISCMTILRSMVLVKLYGLEKLTNSTGMMLMFQGFGSLLGTPTSSIIKNLYGYTASFYVAGIIIAMGGVIIIPIEKMASKESGAREVTENKNLPNSKNLAHTQNK